MAITIVTFASQGSLLTRAIFAYAQLQLIKLIMGNFD